MLGFALHFNIKHIDGTNLRFNTMIQNDKSEV